MNLIFEVLRIVSFWAAVGTYLYCMVKGKLVAKQRDRVMLITIALGFVFGAVWKLMASPIHWTFGLYVIGVFLAYTTVLFSIPAKGGKKRNE